MFGVLVYVLNERVMKKKVNKRNEKNKGLRTSLFVHGVLVALALFPFLKNADWAEINPAGEVEIEFVYADVSSGAASTKPKEVKLPEPKEVKEVVKKAPVVPPVKPVPILTEDATEEVVVEEVPKVDVKEVVLEKPVEVIEEPMSEVIEEVVEVENAKPSEEAGDNESNDSEAGEGDEGEKMTGKKLGKMDFDGEGVFGRKVIHRADVKKITEKEGKVVINLCINREGFVTHVAFNRESSSIDDSEYVKKAMDVASDYLFEKDYTAPDTQCGKLTFIFHIN